jgi:hypothetical protein
MKGTIAFTVVALALLALSAAHATPVMYGSLGNFDCINDTGTTAHGFEIELEGVSPSDIFDTFGAPYNRYGTPSITTDGTKTYVRYAATYSGGTWSAGTDSGTFAPTGGHSLFYPQYGGDPAYPNVPGDHFGVALGVNPTNTVYHWLLDDGTGNLVQAGTNVRVPAPVLNLVPPANPANPVAVQAVVPAPPPGAGEQWGDAIWVKIFTTVIENPDPVDLHDLVLGNAVVPPESETEIEWQLLQTNPERPDLAEKIDEGDVAGGHEAVVRRYEFYAYTGGYDPETHEALHDSYNALYVGDYLGNQNVAANFLIPEPNTMVLALLGAVALGAFGFRGRRRS